MIGLQEFDLEIELDHTVKGHGLYRLIAEATHAQEEEEELANWEQAIKMYDVERAPPTSCINSWYEDVHKYLKHDTITSHLSMR